MIAIGLLFVGMLCDYFKSRPQLEVSRRLFQRRLGVELLQSATAKRDSPHGDNRVWRVSSPGDFGADDRPAVSASPVSRPGESGQIRQLQSQGDSDFNARRQHYWR